ncbi:type VI secretion system contractile sheath domain-containing protein [Roseomonas rosulenta]|uniref:type VI secretion system contractile sheath domain-containing protein n=1 Tax=Roseomonas rosulenta TaxID=2748667 RepID=UPI0018DF801C|nr:type VI secretion system contractile sheath large subunit [Roseomonas rosulenta]
MNPPRLAMTYPFEAEGAAWDRELPFRVGVIADLAGDPALPLPPLAERPVIALGADGVAGAMARLQPGICHDPGDGGEGGAVTLAFRSLDDFGTAGLARQLASAGVTPSGHLIDTIRGTARFRRLEAAWRGLDLLAMRAGDDPAVRICLLPLSHAEFATALRPAEGLAQGWLQARIDDDVFTCRGAEPFALLVGDQAWTAAAGDIEALGEMASIAAAAFVPYVSAADASLCDLARSDRAAQASGAAQAAWAALRGSDASRFLGLTAPPCVSGVPAPFWVAARLIDAFRRDGFCADLPGAEPLSHGQPEAPLAWSGFMPVVQRASDPAPATVGATTVHRPKVYERPETSTNAAIAATLPYVMVTSRIAQYLKAMARDRIGAFAEAGDLEPWMARWLANLARAGAREAALPRHPLYQGSLEVKPAPGEAGSFNAVCYLRPWFPVAVLTTELRLIVRLPRQR